MTLKRSASAANAGSTATFDGQAMHDFALKCPRIGKPSADEALTKLQSLQHRCLQRIIDQLLRSPKFIMPLHSELLMLDPDAKASDDSWAGNYRTIANIPKIWKIGFILGEAKRLKIPSITADYMVKVESEDASNVTELFCSLVQLPDAMVMPPGLNDGLSASRAFTARAKQVGDRLKFLKTRGCFGLEGALDFMKSGSFDLTFREGVASSVQHAPTKTKVDLPEHVRVTTAYTMHMNSLDHKALVRLKPNQFCLVDLFPDDAPFKSLMYGKGKKWRQFADIVAEAIDQQEKEQETKLDEMVVADDHVVAQVVQERSKVNLERAREKLLMKKQERDQKRVRTLG